MNHSKITSVLCGLALVSGMVACGGGNEQSRPSTPIGVSDPQRYGSANAQPQAEVQAATDTSGPNASASTSQDPPAAPPSPPAPSTATWGQGETITAAPPTGGTGSGGSGGAMDLSGFTDGQIAAVLHSIDSGDIQEAQLAGTKAASAEVKQFARSGVTQQKSFDDKATSTLKKSNISSSENAVSQRLSSDAQSQQSMLQGESGRDFDRDYIDAQVKNESLALDLLDKMTLKATDAQLRSMLQDLRPKVEARMKDAQRIQATLQKGPTTKQSPSSPPSMP
jgi:putative membrane protein